MAFQILPFISVINEIILLFAKCPCKQSICIYMHNVPVIDLCNFMTHVKCQFKVNCNATKSYAYVTTY